MLPDLTLDGNSGWLLLILPWIGFAVWWLRLQAHGRADDDTVTAEINSGQPEQVRAVRHTLARGDAQGRADGVQRAFGGSVPGLDEAAARRGDYQDGPGQPGRETGQPATNGSSNRNGAGGSVRDAQAGRRIETAQGPLPESLAMLALPDGETIESEIAEASRIGDQLELATLYLQQGCALREAGDDLRGADTIRKSVMLAMQIRDAKLHAMGRLELGDIAAGQGDLTTACEHWQMAKKMYFEASLVADSDVADNRMLSHGCPTEWVLTDF